MRPLVWCLTHQSLRSDCQFGTKAGLVTRQQKNSRRKCMLVVQHLGAVETAAHLIDQFFSVCRCGTDRQGGPAHRGHRLHPPLWGDGNAQTAPDINAVLTGNSRSGGFYALGASITLPQASSSSIRAITSKPAAEYGSNSGQSILLCSSKSPRLTSAMDQSL